MDLRDKRREKIDNDRKRQKFLKMLSSFTVTAVVATTALFFPALPTAEFLSLTTFGNAVYYETSVIDAESAITDGSLKIILESGADSREASLALGTDSGLFADLSPGSEYTAAIVANRGFGQTTLIEQTIRVADSPGWKIIGKELLTVIDPAVHDQMLSYLVSTYLFDPQGIYSNIRVLYGTVYAGEGTQMETEPQMWTPASPGSEPGQYLLEGIYNWNLKVFVRLMADTGTETDLILDTSVFFTPLKFNASLYVTEAEETRLAFSFYPDFGRVEDAIYTVELRQGDRVIGTRTVAKPAETSGPQPGYDQILLEFTGLAVQTEYTVECRVDYLDPETGQPATLVLSSETVMTTPPWEGTLEWVWDSPGFLHLTYLYQDPEGILSSFQVTVEGLDADGNVVSWNYGSLTAVPTEGGGTAEAVLQVTDAVSYSVSIQGTITLSDTLVYNWATLVDSQAIPKE